MDLFLPLISLLLIAGGDCQHATFADAAMTTSSNSRSLTPMRYWEAVLPKTPMPRAISDLIAQQNAHSSLDDITIGYNDLKFVKGPRKFGPNYERVKPEADHRDKPVHIPAQVEDDLKKVFESEHEEDSQRITMLYGSEHEEDPKRITMAYGSEHEEDPKRITMSYGSEHEEDPKRITMSYGSEHEEDPKRITMSYGSKHEEDPKRITMSYGSEHEDGPQRITISYGSKHEEDPKRITMSYVSAHEDDPRRITMSYGSEHEEDPKRITMSYGSELEEDLDKLTMSYGKKHEEEPKRITMSYGSELEENPDKITMMYGKNSEVDPKRITMLYGSKLEESPDQITMSFGSQNEEDPEKNTMSYALEHEEDPYKLTISDGSAHKKDLKYVSKGYGTHREVTPTEEGSHHVHAQSHNGRRKQLADVFFFHDMLRLGSVITPTIPPTTSLPALLPRRVASSIPFSTERLAEILTTFAPVSPEMTREIRWTLDSCEHPRTLPGEAAGCATSVESLAELPASLLRTRNIRAFSASDLPVEAIGTPALRGRYNVTAVRKLSGQSSETVTCHDLKYPYAVYYCHTASPAAAYAVTLASVEDCAAPATMEALAVCHLDTSRWSPKHPFLEVHSVRPGDVAVCHFLTKLSMVWVRADEQGDDACAAAV